MKVESRLKVESAGAGLWQKRPWLSKMDLALLATVLCWGIGYVAFTLLQREMTPGILNLLRYLIATPLFWLAFSRSKEPWRLPMQHVPRAILTGVIGLFLYGQIFVIATGMTTAANVALLLTLSPIWTKLIGLFTGGTRPTIVFLGGSLVALVGAGMVIGFGAGKLGFRPEALMGDLLALLCSIIWAFYGVAAQPLLRQYSSTKIQAWISLFALAGLILYQGAALFLFDWTAVSLIGWLSLVYLSVLGTVFGHIVWYTAIAKVGMDRAMVAMYLVPVVAASAGALFLQQPIMAMQVVGGAVALAGVAIVRGRS